MNNLFSQAQHEIERNDAKSDCDNESEDFGEAFQSLSPNLVAETDGLESRPETVGQVQAQEYAAHDVKQAVNDACVEQACHQGVCVLHLYTVDGHVCQCRVAQRRELDVPPEVVQVDGQENQNHGSQDVHVPGRPLAVSALVAAGILDGTCAPVLKGQDGGQYDMENEPDSQNRLDDFDYRVGHHEVGSNVVQFSAVVKNQQQIQCQMHAQERNKKKPRKTQDELFPNRRCKEIAHN